MPADGRHLAPERLVLNRSGACGLRQTPGGRACPPAIPAGRARKTTLAALVALALSPRVVSSNASPAAAVQDPERNATTPTGWHFWVGQTRAKIDKLADQAGERVVDVNVDSVSPLRFSAVLVRNTGPYARIGGWSYGSEAAVTNKINATKGRLIDLEPYTDQGKRRFAYVWVKNSGDAGKGWHWNYDLSRQRGHQGDQQVQGPPDRPLDLRRRRQAPLLVHRHRQPGRRRARRGGGTSTSLRSSSSSRRRRTALD